MTTQKVFEFNKSIELIFKVLDQLLFTGLVDQTFDGGLTEAQMESLMFVTRNQELSCYKKVRISDLADALNISLPAATKAINRLLERDLIKKVRDIEDYRNILIYPTDKGLDYVDRYNQSRIEKVTELRNKCTEEEFNILIKSAKILIEKTTEDLSKNQLLKICRKCGIEHQEDCIVKKMLAKSHA